VEKGIGDGSIDEQLDEFDLIVGWIGAMVEQGLHVEAGELVERQCLLVEEGGSRVGHLLFHFHSHIIEGIDFELTVLPDRGIAAGIADDGKRLLAYLRVNVLRMKLHAAKKQ